MKLRKLADDRYAVMMGDEQVGEVFSVPVPDRSYVRWQFAGNPYPRALFRSPYEAARKLMQRRTGNYRQTVAQLNRRPLS